MNSKLDCSAVCACVRVYSTYVIGTFVQIYMVVSVVKNKLYFNCCMLDNPIYLHTLCYGISKYDYMYFGMHELKSLCVQASGPMDH